MTPVQLPAANLTVVLANIKSVPRMPTDEVDADITALFELAHRKGADAVFGAEIAFPDYRRAWRRQSRGRGYVAYGVGRECPISLDRGLEGRAVVRLLSSGVARVSPSRYVTVVKERGPLAGKVRVAYVATHLASRWQDYARTDTDHQVRVRLARQEIAAIKRRVRRLHRRGWTVVIGGDLNAIDHVQWHPAQVDVLPVAGGNLAKMMQLAVVPAAGIQVRPQLHGDVHKDLHTDHPFRWAAFRLEATR